MQGLLVGGVENLVLLHLVLVELQGNDQLLQNLSTGALRHGLLHELADVVVPQRRHPDDARVAGLVGEHGLAVRVEVHDPRETGGGQRALAIWRSLTTRTCAEQSRRR